MIQLDPSGQPQRFTYILSRRDHTHLGQLNNVLEDEYLENLNGADEISFVLNKPTGNELEQMSEEEREQTMFLWNELVDFKFVYVKEVDEYFEIYVSIDDEQNVIKSVSGIGAAEAELGQSIIYGLEINTEMDIARDDYTSPTVFYDALHPENSLLNRTLSKLPQWSVDYVDSSLMTLQRTFSTDDEDVYSFLTGTVAEEIGCLFKFDSVNRTVSAYDLKSVCMDCGYRGEFTDECPKCGSTTYKYYGEDTTILIDTEELAENISFETDTDSVKNCFRLEAGDDNMTAAVINRNPNGSAYIYYFSEEQKHEMPAELVEKLESYDELVASYDEEYGELMQNIYDYIDKVVYYQSGMMPTVETQPTTAADEAAKLTVENMSPMGMAEITQYTSQTTVENALEQYVKVFIKSGWYKAEVKDSNWNFIGYDAEENVYGLWTGNFTVTNYSDEEDTATSPTIQIKVYDNYQDFLEQKIKKKLKLEDNDEGSVFDVLSIEGLEPFKEAIKLYGLNRLQSFMDAIQGCIDIMIEADQANENSELYEELYVPYYEKLVAVQAEIDVRQATIDDYTSKLETAQKRQREIQKALNFEAYLGTDMYKTFCCYKREDTYSNDNYISDGLENDEIFENAAAFLEAAKDELYKSGEHQHQISGSLLNFLAMEEFAPLKEHFKTGSFIRAKIDGTIYRLRLIQIQLSFDRPENIEIEFSDVTKIRNGVTDAESILKQASSVASSYDSVTNQVKKSKDSTDMIQNFVNYGLDATTMKIVNNADNQNIVINDAGLLARRKDDFTNTYEDNQIKLLSNGLYFTSNSWRSVKSAFGKYIYVDPETGQQEIKFGILAESIVGQLLIGEQLRLYSSDASAEMSFDNYGLRLNTKRNESGQYKRIFDIQRDGESIFYIDNSGNLVFAEDEFIGMIEKLERINVKYLDADNLFANTGTIVSFGSSYAKIEELEAPRGTITALTADTIEAASAHFTGDIRTDSKIIAAFGSIDNLTTTTGSISELSSFRATLENLSATIGEIETLTSDYIKVNTLEAGAVRYTDLQAAQATIDNLIADIATIENLTATTGAISSLTVDTKADVEFIVANIGNFTKLNADLAVIKELQADVANLTKAIIPTLEATNATVESLTATLGDIETLTSGTITVDKLIASSAEIEDLDAVIGDFDEIKAQLANIETILAGNIGSGAIQTIHLTAQNVVIDDAVIKNMIATKITVSDLKAGTISTDKFTIKSDDGGMQIVGSTQQFTDGNGKVRLQIGKDGQGNFNFVVFGEDGTTAIYDENGIHEGAIPDGIIRDDMVADNAGIQGSKLDIDSVIDTINEDGTRTISSSKIWIDEENQSLGASFDQIKQSVDNAATDEDIQQALDDLKVGASNMIRNAKTMIFPAYGIRGGGVTNNYPIIDSEGNYLTDSSGNILVG